MDILVIKTPRGLRGWTPADQKAYAKFKRFIDALAMGEMFQLDFSVPRNLAHHKKFFALVGLLAEMSDVYDNKDKALAAIKIAAGHCEFIPNPLSIELIALPKSISFAEMDQLAFDAFYENAVNGVLKFLLPTMNRVDFDAALEQVVQF